MTKKTMPAITVGFIAVVIIAAAGFIYKAKQSEEQQQTTATTTTLAKSPAKTTAQPLPKPEPEPNPAAAEITDAVKQIPPSIINAPSTLENSDAIVLLAASDFSPAITQWLLPDEQIRKWVLAVDLIADGKLPKRYRPVDYPMAKFKTQGDGLKQVSSRENYQRMNLMINALTDIEVATLARYYKAWLPLLEKAYQEQGKTDTFNQRFMQSISQILTVNSLHQQPALIRPSVLYQFENPDYENASDIEKLLWRMGPDNTEELQGFLRELRYQLEQ